MKANDVINALLAVYYAFFLFLLGIFLTGVVRAA